MCVVKLGSLVLRVCRALAVLAVTGPSTRTRMFVRGAVEILNDIGVLGVRCCVPANFLRTVWQVIPLTDLLTMSSRRTLT